MPNLLPTSSPDPFTLVYCSLWDMLEAHRGFVGLVSPANRIKWLGSAIGPLKEEVTQSDKPEVRIDPGEPFATPIVVSGANALEVAWKIYVATDSQPLDALGVAGIGGGVFGVMWEVYRALIGWQQSIIDLTYNGASFVHQVQTGSPILTLNDKDLNRGTKGWSTGWNYYTLLQFSTPLILPVPVTP